MSIHTPPQIPGHEPPAPDRRTDSHAPCFLPVFATVVGIIAICVVLYGVLQVILASNAEPYDESAAWDGLWGYLLIGGGLTILVPAAIAFFTRSGLATLVSVLVIALGLAGAIHPLARHSTVLAFVTLLVASGIAGYGTYLLQRRSNADHGPGTDR